MLEDCTDNNYFCKCKEFDETNSDKTKYKTLDSTESWSSDEMNSELSNSNSKSKSITNEQNLFINQLQSNNSDLRLQLENEQLVVLNLKKKLFNSNKSKELELSEINSVINNLDEEYENSMLEIKNLNLINNDLINNNEFLINEKMELMSINSDLNLELQSQKENLSELNELRKLNIELEDNAFDTLTIIKASKAEQLESEMHDLRNTELHDLRNIKNDYEKTYKELN